MKLHTKQLQIGINSAVATQLLPHPKIPTGSPHNGEFSKKYFWSVAASVLLFLMIKLSL